jgi:hypothetical protein
MGPNGKLGVAEKSKNKYSEFVKGITPGQTIECFFEANKDDGTLDQLAKAHVCIRELAKETGATFEEMKLEVKKRAGLCFTTDYNGEKVLFCKSLADASKEELGLLMETIIALGDFNNINFR